MNKPTLFRGIFLLTTANAIFLGSGYVIQVLLGRYFSPEVYGLFGVLIYIVNILNTIFASGFLEGISRSVARKPESANTILRHGLLIELLLSGGIGLVYFLFSPLLAHIFNQPEITKYIAFSALLIPIYGLRSVYLGLLNGLKEFTAQSLAIIFAAIVKIGLVALFVYQGHGLVAILIAYFCAALGSLLVGYLYTRVHRQSNEPSSFKNLGTLALTLSLYASLLPLLSNIDLLFVKSIITDTAAAGYYNAATTLARFPQFLLGSFGAALLPFIASDYHAGRIDRSRFIVQHVLKYSILLLVPIIIISVFSGDQLIQLIYTDAYAPAIHPFMILIFALCLLSVVQILLTTLIGIGSERSVVTIVLWAIAVDVVALIVGVNYFGLVGAAWSTLLAALFVFILSFPLLRKNLQWHTFPKVPILKLILLTGVLSIVAQYLFENPLNHALLLLTYAFFLVGYVVLLLLSKIITLREVTSIKSILFRSDIS
ncbi:MAG: oligosaccharide flippase family protein [Patescibacteria group bacterium]|jgi:O-antigen/teichoic acid export membrane protein